MTEVNNTVANNNAPKQRTPNDVLTDALDKLDFALVVGIDKNGDTHMDTNRPTFEHVNYILNRGLATVQRLELDNMMARKQANFQAAEQAVEAQVAENVAKEIEQVAPKRGRPKKVI